MKKFYSKLALLLVLVLTLASFFGVATFSADEVGDVDGDGKATAADAIYVLYSSVFGEEDYPLPEGCDFNADGKVDSRDAVYLLYYTIWGEEFYPMPGSGDIGSQPTGRVAITLVDGETSTLYKLIPGADLPTLKDRFDDEFVRSRFLGWYDESLTQQFTVVPENAATYYAVFKEDDTEGKIKLINGGNVELSDLAVGATLPTLSTISEPLSDDLSYTFAGWYNQDGTVKYTTVTEGVDTYFARYNGYTSYSFETDAIYNPDNRYTNNFGVRKIAAWERAVDPEGGNLTVKANLSKNGNTTHIPLQLFEGSTEGFKLQNNKKYVITFNYYLKSSTVSEGGVSVRGSALENIGVVGGKTSSMGNTELHTVNAWDTASLLFDTIVDTDGKDEIQSEYDLMPYLIFLSQGNGAIDDVNLYIDNFIIREFDSSLNVTVKAPVYDITFNNNGAVTTVPESYIGDTLPTVTSKYYGANFLGWYDEDLAKRYANVPSNAAKLYAKYDGAIMDFEFTAPYDPNGNMKPSNGLSPYEVVTDPTDENNTVIGAHIGGNNSHFAVKTAYDELGYVLQKNVTYEISFKYMVAADIPENEEIHISFRGCDEANIGISGGKSGGFGASTLVSTGSWVYETVKQKYTGDQPYLIMLAQCFNKETHSNENTVGGMVYFDDIVVKKVADEKTYSAQTINLNGKVLGSDGQEINIVIPDYNFPYIATMQVEELDKALTKITGAEVNIVKKSSWTEKDNQFNVFVNEVGADSKLGKDQLRRVWGESSVTLDGGSTWSLAMSISELIKAVNKTTGISTGATKVDNYNDLINNYSTVDYYRPTFVEDFDQADIDTTIWNVHNSVEANARDIVDENGNTLSADTHGWKRARSAKHSYLEDGKFVISGAYDKDTKIFYGGMLKSHGQMEYLYGYLETSVITPHGQSLWSAVWLTPNGGGTGLYRPEVDINESFGDASKTAFNMHAWLTGAGANLGYAKYSFDNYTERFEYKVGGIMGGLIGGKTYNYRYGYAPEGETLNDRFHTFGFMWTPEYAQFIVDGQVSLTYNFEGTDSHYNKYGMTNVDAYNEYMSVIVSMTVGNASSGSNPVLGADYWNTTNKYIVDYVHIYQIDGQFMRNNPREAKTIDRTLLTQSK